MASTTSTTPDPTVEVEQAYWAYEEMHNRLRENPDPDDPEIALRTTGRTRDGIVRSYWEPVTAHAEVPGVAVTVTAEPTRLIWEMGDGETVTCDGPGTAWDFEGTNPEASDCSHIFQHISSGEPDGCYDGSVDTCVH